MCFMVVDSQLLQMASEGGCNKVRSISSRCTLMLREIPDGESTEVQHAFQFLLPHNVFNN